MISVRLTKAYSSSVITQHYGTQGRKIKPMVIPECRRCIAIFIFWQTLFEDGQICYSISALHLLPGSPRSLKKARKKIFKILSRHVPGGIPYSIAVSGGAIDTPQNEFLYKNSYRRYIKALQKKYPDVFIGIYYPEKNVFNTTMFLRKDGVVGISQKIYDTT